MKILSLFKRYFQSQASLIKENICLLFLVGFRTKSTGHDFALYACTVLLKDIGDMLEVKGLDRSNSFWIYK
jgi:hypothetical protein